MEVLLAPVLHLFDDLFDAENAPQDGDGDSNDQHEFVLCATFTSQFHFKDTG